MGLTDGRRKSSVERMDTSLPAAFASHFTAKVAATCSLVSIAVLLLLAAPADEPVLLNRFGICAFHATLALFMFALEHRFVVRKDALPDSSIVSTILLYFVNVGAATLPVVILFYGREALGILAPK